MIRQIAKLTFLVVAVVMLGACTQNNRAFHATNHATFAAQQSILHDRARAATTEPAVITKPGYYVSTKPIALNNYPSWFYNRINLRAQDVPFSFVLNRILRNTDAGLDYQPGVNSNKTIGINYAGTIKGALDSLALKTGYAYNVNQSQISWAAFITKTFDVSFLPGSSTYMVGQQAGSSNSNSSDTDVSTMKGNLDDNQYSSLQGNLSVWNDLKTTLNSLKSKTGTVEVSEATTSVTVHDHPANVRAVAKYIKQLNANLSRQVELKVRVLQVDLNNSHKFGVDWNIMQKALGTKINLIGNVVSTLSSGGAATTANPPSLIIGNNAPTSSHALITALGEQGKVSVVTEPTVVTLNNQVAEVRIDRDTSYLKQVQTTVTGAASTSQTSLTPGIVTDGFNLYLLPKIQENKVYLQISSMISNLEGISTATSGSGANQSSIQIPTLAEKRFLMKSLVENGNTLVIAGFKQLHNETHQTQLFGSTELGGRGSDRQNVETIILITPTIIENNS